MVLVAVASVPSARPLQPEPFYPPPKFPGTGTWAGLEAEASSGHDEESGALTGSLSNRFHFGDRGAGG